MNIILEDLKAKSELLQFDIDTLNEELNSINTTTFEYNPRIDEIATELADLHTRKNNIDKEIIEYTKKIGG